MSYVDQGCYRNKNGYNEGVTQRSVGSIAARAQAWEKSNTSGYVTIGSIRYGVRFASSISNQDVVPSRGSVKKQLADDTDCCCGVVQLAWPRGGASPLPPSRIPLSNSDKAQAINKRCVPTKSVEENEAPVYASSHTPQSSCSRRTPVNCFAVPDHGHMKTASPAPSSFRNRIFVRPPFKFCSSSSDTSETSRLLPPTDSKDELTTECGSGGQFQSTLDKLHKFRFGGGAEKANETPKKKRNGDKTERLRELTDKLRGRTPASPDRKKPPPIPGTSTPSKLPTKQHNNSTTSSVKNIYGSSVSLTGDSSGEVTPKRASSVASVTSCETIKQVTPQTSASEVPQQLVNSCSVDESDDKFQCDDVTLRKAESRPIVGSYTQRTIAFRSASFSQVDFDAIDGKYTRNNKENTRTCSKSSLPSYGVLGSMTFPRKTHADASTSVSPPPDKIFEEITSSTPSVDSAVGSDENFGTESTNTISTMSDAPHRPPGSRSLTYPLGKKSSISDDISYSSIDGNGMKSLHSSTNNSSTRELTEVKEELSSPEDIKSSLILFDNESDKPNAESNVVYECTVQEYPCVFNKEETVIESVDVGVEKVEEVKTEKSLQPEIYVTTWPREANEDTMEETKTEEKNHEEWEEQVQGAEKETEINDDEVAVDEKKEEQDDAKRWSDRTDGSRTSGDWCASPDDIGTKPEWTKERPKLVCQSSDERDDDGRPTPRYHQLLSRADSLSEGDSDQGERRPSDRDRTCSPSPLFSPVFDLSDNETKGLEKRTTHGPRRYSKRPLRGPYGQMLEAEMQKPDTTRMLSKRQIHEDLKFLEDFVPPLPKRSLSPVNSNRTLSETRLPSTRPRANTSHSLDDSQLRGVYGSGNVKRKISANIPFTGPGTINNKNSPVVCHQRTTSSPSQLEVFSVETTPSPVNRTDATHELLAELLKGSSEGLFMTDDQTSAKDTRTHVVVELFDTERSYVESLQIIVMKYLQPLKSTENSALVDSVIVDEIFYQVPSILMHHELLLDELRKRLEHWDVRQKVGDVFLDTFTKESLVETYTSFINNWTTAKEAIKSTSQQKPAFARFLEAMAREHKGKLGLDQLLIKPVQRIPRYELLIQRLLKHTDPSHPDHALLLAAQHRVHELATKINLTERETLELEQQQQTLRDIEALIEGLVDLTSAERCYLRHDTVTMASGQGTRKERALFLFSDLLVITSIKRRTGTIRKPSTCPGSVASTLDANKYKLLMKIPLEDLEVVKTKDENLKRLLREIEKLTQDVATLSQITELTTSLHCPHTSLDDLVKEMLTNVNKQLNDKQTADSQLSYLELTLNTPNGAENISVVFTKPDKRSSWEESFNDAKQKLALSADRRPTPAFVTSVPIRKTRAGLQFTCAAPTLGVNSFNLRDVWVCNSDGYVGQVCVLCLQPEPNVTSCNGVCNARILSVAAIPAGTPGSTTANETSDTKTDVSAAGEDTESGNIRLDSSSSSEDEDDPAARSSRDTNKLRTTTTDPLTNEAPEEDNPTMWLGTEDGNIYIYNCYDNIRIKKNKVKIQHGSSVHCIIYLDNRVFVSLANGDIFAYNRDYVGGWNTQEPMTATVGSAAAPVTKMLPVSGKLWCGSHNSVKILNTATLQVEHSFQVNSDNSKVVTGMVGSGLGVWISQQNSAIVRLFHATTYECLCDINVAPAVTKMLAGCDDIIRQHKAACLRVTSLLACKDLLWIGTSAGVVLTLPLPHIAQSTTKITNVPNIIGLPQGHTGHVRFLTCVETNNQPETATSSERTHRYSLKMKGETHQQPINKLLVLSGGDGYEDFRNANSSEIAGREDSTNHLLLWNI